VRFFVRQFPTSASKQYRHEPASPLISTDPEETRISSANSLTVNQQQRKKLRQTPKVGGWLLNVSAGISQDPQEITVDGSEFLKASRAQYYFRTHLT
jgi:hypothetical protein